MKTGCCHAAGTVCWFPSLSLSGEKRARTEGGRWDGIRRNSERAGGVIGEGCWAYDDGTHRRASRAVKREHRAARPLRAS